MAVNLLPEELKPKKYIVRISKTLTNVALIALLVFITSAVVITGIFFVVSGRLDDSQEKQESLKKEIKALEETEQKIVLIKDRLGKIDFVLSESSASDKVDILDDVIQLSGDYAQVKGADLSNKQSDISVNVDSSLDLTKLLSNLVGSGKFGKIEMFSFVFKPEEGYDLVLGILR